MLLMVSFEMRRSSSSSSVLLVPRRHQWPHYSAAAPCAFLGFRSDPFDSGGLVMRTTEVNEFASATEAVRKDLVFVLVFDCREDRAAEAAAVVDDSSTSTAEGFVCVFVAMGRNRSAFVGDIYPVTEEPFHVMFHKI